MDNPIVDPVTPPVIDPVVTPPAPAAPSNLPSDAPAADLIGGKWENTDAMLDHIKDMEDKYANSQRDLANNKPADPATPDAPVAPTDAQIAQETLVRDDLMPEFLKNGMIITPEMITKATAAGIDERDLKLGAYEMKDNLQKSFAITGGEENYSAMIEWGKVNLNDAQKRDFDKGLANGMGEYAVKGLWSDFQNSDGANHNPNERLSGNPAPKGIQPYADRKSLYADKDYVESAAGRRDPAALQRYRARLRLTPDSVLGI